MKSCRKIVCLLMAAVLALLSPAAAFAEGEPGTGPEAQGTREAQDFPASDRSLIYNTTDSSKLPTYVDGSDVHGFINTEEAEEIESMFSDDAVDRFSSLIRMADEFEPVKDTDVSLVLGRVERFISSGNYASYIENGNLLMDSEIGLTRNKTDKVKVLGGENAGAGSGSDPLQSTSGESSWVFVVDKDAMCWWIKDEDGNGIPHALVTISYIDESGQRVTESITATDGHTPGIAAFDELPDAFYGIVDIQAPGYRAVSILDKMMEAGEHYTMVLSKAEENELYIRGVDLSGKDMVNEETGLYLVDFDTEDLTLKVLITRNGTAEFPDQISLRSDTRGKTVLTIDQASGYAYDSNTRVYTASRRWAEQNAGLLQADDIVTIDYGGNSFELEHLTVDNSVLKPGVGQTNVPVTSKPLPGNVSDRLGGAGWINITAQILQVPVTFGVFPDGGMILMASYDMTRLNPDIQSKYSSLFDKSWNPKGKDGINDPLQSFERSFWENADKVKGGREVLNSPDKLKCIANKNYNFTMSFSLFLRSAYNKETDDWFGVGGFMFSDSFSGGVTEYLLIPAGPVVIPAYLGFNVGIGINVAISVNFALDEPPAGEGSMYKWKYAASDGWDTNLRIDFLIDLSLFGGIGVKGVLGAAAEGYLNFDFGTLMGKGKASILDPDPHSLIDVFYGMKINYYLLFFSGEIKFDCLNGAKRLSDSWGEEDLAAETGAAPEIEFTDMDLAACADNLVPVVDAGGGTPHDPLFTLNEETPSVEGTPSVTTIDNSTYPDTQIQYAATKNYTALFRLASAGNRTDIYYQRINPQTGNVMSGLYKVQLPEGETRSVSEFVVVPNKTDSGSAYEDNVYIGAVLADNTLTDEGERMRSTDVAAMVVNLDETLTKSSVIASNPDDKGQYIYSAPMPAGREDYSSVVYASTFLKDDNGSDIDTLTGLLGATPGYTSYKLSWCDAGQPAVRYYKNIGSDKIYSSGAIAPNEPTYWAVDPLKSSDKYLVVKGYGANGYYEETLRNNFRIDIDGLIDPADIAAGTMNFNTIITNWQYLNGCNYFIAGDSIYWMNKKVKSGNDYEWVVNKVENGSGVISVDNRYTMITNNDQSAIYLIGVVDDYEVDVQGGTAEKTFNKARIYTITLHEYSSGETVCKLHGPLELKFGKGDVVSSFTAAYNPNDCQSSGLSIVYTTPVRTEGSRYACRIRMWKQNANKGVLVNGVRIPDYLVVDGQPYIELFVTTRNYGYAIEGPISYKITDEEGRMLMQTINGQDVGNVYYTGTDLYTGDSRVDKIVVRPIKEWKTNTEHEIHVDINGSEKYNGELDDIVNNSARMEADNISVTAENRLVGGKHYVRITIRNNTFVEDRMPQIKAVFRYNDPEKEKTMTFSLPVKDLMSKYQTGRVPGRILFASAGGTMPLASPEEEMVEQAYHYDLDMDKIWEDGLKEGLLGIYFSLVNEDGEQTSNEEVFVENPAEERPEIPHGTVKVTLTDADDPEKLLSGAVFGIYNDAGERIGELKETAPGVYEISDVPAGEYTVKLEKAPKGYKAEGEYKATISKDGVTIELAAKAEAEAPATGDHSQTILYNALLTAALAAIVVLIISGRKKKN